MKNLTTSQKIRLLPTNNEERQKAEKLADSAPELLEACVELMGIYESYGITMPTELKTKFQNAIKKATE